MDDEEYKRKLSEVADWYIPTNPERPNRKPQRRKTDEQILELVGEDSQQEEQSTGPNHTIAPVVRKLRIQGCHCEDCGKFCENGRQTEKKIYQTKKPHWRERCVTCNRWKHPATGEYTLTNIEISQMFSALHRETQGVNNSKYAKARELISKNKEKTVIETDTATITLYHEKTPEA